MRGWGCFRRVMASEVSGRSQHGLVKLPAEQGGHEAVPSFTVPLQSMSLKTRVATETCLPLRTFAQVVLLPRDGPCSSQGSGLPVCEPYLQGLL